ncbi:MAG: hypothetical protein AAFY11_01680 [Cyanobacteria bacterium J06641_5]
MTPTPQASMADLMAQRDRWLAEQIRQLSVDVLSQGIFTCTECSLVSGEYIIQQGAETQRLSAAEAYAFLQFTLSSK